MLAACTVALFLAVGTNAESDPFTSGRASFSLHVKGHDVPYHVFGLYVLPYGSLRIDVGKGKDAHVFAATATAGRLEPAGKTSWNWVAPEHPGLYVVTVLRTDSEETITLNVFVMYPRDRVEDGKLNGYVIGKYPSTLLKNLAIYRPPAGFVEVTEENEDTPISPHFTLGQFPCKQESDYPKYLALREPLLLKLELLLQHVNDRGIRSNGFVIMSGYRTPVYNAAIGNVKYSRHVWGGAADIYIDENPQDGVMDDLDGNGVFDEGDAAVLYDVVDELYGKTFYEPFIGGLGRYRRTEAHGPFVHVDVRGFRARWGD